MLAGRTPVSHLSRSSAILLVAVLALLTGCQSTRPDAPTIVRVENHQLRPPNFFGFISQGHPDYPTAADVPPRHKVVPSDLMGQVLALLEDNGFDADASAALMPTEEVPALPILRRILRTVGDDSRALVVPRQPDPRLAQKFSVMARELGRMFNRVNYLRHDEGLEDPDLFKKEQERLEEQQRTSGGSQR